MKTTKLRVKDTEDCPLSSLEKSILWYINQGLEKKLIRDISKVSEEKYEELENIILDKKYEIPLKLKRSKDQRMGEVYHCLMFGMNIQEISQRLNIGVSTVRLYKRDLKKDGKVFPAINPHFEKFIRELKKNKPSLIKDLKVMTLNEVGKKYKVSGPTIRTYVDRDGKITNEKAKKVGFKLNKKSMSYVFEEYPKVKLAMKLFDEGKDYDDICNELKITKGYFGKFLSIWRSRGVPFPKSTNNKPIKKKYDKDFLKNHMLEKEKRINELKSIANDWMLGYHASQISEKYDIELHLIGSRIYNLKERGYIPKDFRRKSVTMRKK